MTDPAIGAIETEVAMLLRRAEASRRAGAAPHRALDRAAYLILRRVAGVRAAREDLYTNVLATWSATDRQNLATLLTRLNHALDAHARR